MVSWESFIGYSYKFLVVTWGSIVISNWKVVPVGFGQVNIFGCSTPPCPRYWFLPWVSTLTCLGDRLQTIRWNIPFLPPIAFVHGVLWQQEKNNLRHKFVPEVGYCCGRLDCFSWKDFRRTSECRAGKAVGCSELSRLMGAWKTRILRSLEMKKAVACKV